VLSDKQGILAKRRALAEGERNVRDDGFESGVRRKTGPDGEVQEGQERRVE